jgi:hypothetical protein
MIDLQIMWINDTNDWYHEGNTLTWSDVSALQWLTEYFMDKWKKELNWHVLSKCQKMSETFIDTHKKYVDWDMISQYQVLSEAFIETHGNRVNWDLISQYQVLSEAFIEAHEKLLNWSYLSIYQKLTEKMIIAHRFDMNWFIVITHQTISGWLLEWCYGHYIKHDNSAARYLMDWICEHQKITESFIIKYEDTINWNLVSRYQDLTEHCIILFKDKVNWDYISLYQKLSYPFIKKNIDLLNTALLQYNKRCVPLTYKMIRDYCIPVGICVPYELGERISDKKYTDLTIKTKN